MTDEHYVTAMKLRLCLPLPTGQGHCQHRGADGTCCGAPLDGTAVHPISCMCGGLLVKKHDRIKQNLAHHMEALENFHNVRMEQIVPEAAAQLANPRMDICATDAAGKTVHIDVTVASPLTASAIRAGSAFKPGIAAAILEKHELNKYRVAELAPFAVETCGRLGDHAADLFRRIAPAGANKSRSISMMQQDLATILQRLNAEMVLTSASPA